MVRGPQSTVHGKDGRRVTEDGRRRTGDGCDQHPVTSTQ